MAQGINYPILLNPSKKVNITYEQFKKLSYIGLSSFFCNYKVVFGMTDEHCIMYMNDGTQHSFWGHKRFESLKDCWWENSSAELVYCKIPLEHPLVELIKRKFSHLIME
jgi:hypothetical protein